MEKKHGSKGFPMPKDHHETAQGELSHECKRKYATEMGNPQSLDKMTSGLANYVKKHPMKYE